MSVFVQIANNTVVARIVSEEMLQHIRLRLQDDNVFDVTAVHPQPYVGWEFDGEQYVQPDAVTIEEVKIAKVAEINQKAEIMYNLGFYSTASGTKMWYDSDPESQALIHRQYNLALNQPEIYKSTVFAKGYIPGVTPIRARETMRTPKTEKTVQMLNTHQMITLGNDLMSVLYTIKTINWDLQNAVNDANTIEEVMTVEWPRQYD